MTSSRGCRGGESRMMKWPEGQNTGLGLVYEHEHENANTYLTPPNEVVPTASTPPTRRPRLLSLRRVPVRTRLVRVDGDDLVVFVPRDSVLKVVTGGFTSFQSDESDLHTLSNPLAARSMCVLAYAYIRAHAAPSK
jgi:hypothetical protein